MPIFFNAKIRGDYMEKIASRIGWENEPSTNTPINEENLNKMDIEINTLDDRVILLDEKKANESDVLQLVSDVAFDENTGIITITKKNGSVITIDTKMEKISVNFEYDTVAQQIILTLVDGTKQYIDLSALITQYEFLDSDTVIFVVQTDGKIKAEIPDGSITENKLQPNYLAEIKVESANAMSSAINAKASETNSKESANLAQSYAVGGTGIRGDVEDTDNAKYYNEQAQKALESMQAAQVTGVKGDNEDKYRKGDVNLTAENIGAVATEGDTADNIVSFTSKDTTDPTEYTDVEILASGEKHSSLFAKISTMFKNIRYMYKMLGTTDISAIGDGTVTGGLNSINSNLSHVGMIIHSTTLDTMEKVIAIYGGTKWVKIEGRMLLGADNTYAVNSTGGEASHNLTINEMPSHNHIFTGNRALTESAGYHTHATVRSSGTGGRNDWGLVSEGAFGGNVILAKNQGTTYSEVEYNGNHQHYYTPSGSIGNSGGSKAHNNMPPYKVVYIWERTE